MQEQKCAGLPAMARVRADQGLQLKHLLVCNCLTHARSKVVTQVLRAQAGRLRK